MVQEYLTIQEASDLVNKSFQTLRRSIKANKIKFRRQRTPQGFNYLILKNSLLDFYKTKNGESVKEAELAEASTLKAIPVEKAEIVDTPKEQTKNEEVTVEVTSKERIEKDDYITKDDLKSITQALEKMISQHSDERQNFIRLINTLNEKIFVLENQVKLLTAPKKSWLSFWKK